MSTEEEIDEGVFHRSESDGRVELGEIDELEDTTQRSAKKNGKKKTSLSGPDIRSIAVDDATESAEKAKLNRFLSKKRILNELQAEIFGISLPPVSNETEYVSSTDENPYIMEGDIVYTEEQLDRLIEDVRGQLFAKYHPEGPKQLSLTPNLAMRWTLPIPYYFDSEVNRTTILAGIRLWEQETCIRFTRKDRKPPGKNAIYFINGTGCYSSVGMIPSWGENYSEGQPVSLWTRGCNYLGTVVHEIAHALGAIHEQSRSDRDSYVIIMENNIKNGQLHNFLKESFLDYGVGYDYGSVMHYSKNAFAIVPNKPTILPKDPMMENVIGQKVGLSFLDVKKMNLAYCSSVCRNTLPCQNYGYVNPNNCNVCKCPPPYGGKLCDRLQLSGCGDLTLTATSSSKTITASGTEPCYFLITAPRGKKIQFKMLKFLSSEMCEFCYIEIKMNRDFIKYGPRFCRFTQTTILSETNEAMIVFQGYYSTNSFSMEYRIA
ncbi:hypothetical protein CRE_06152 [Caenorhabditis remanei]|uniref:Zinc metalloproteinase n=1 Tax=Caenorhabditis remanei TaxID=31234 RepID=E3NGV7_CAERE|nr:hypothetical protein CRE_06152 [Caenorhabditis remanei]